MNHKTEELEDWYRRHYGNGERIKLRELWMFTTDGTSKSATDAKQKAMERIQATIQFLKTKRPSLAFELYEFEEASRGAWGEPQPGTRGWVDAVEKQ